MKRISFDKRFVNKEGNDLITGKIHTIRQNFLYWKKFEGKEVALFTWEGKPYRSKQKVFCIKKIISVQKIEKETGDREPFWLHLCEQNEHILHLNEIAENDGLKEKEFEEWFDNYPDGYMAILHFTDYRY